MMQSLSKPIRRVLALSLLVAVLTVVVTTTVLPYLSAVDQLTEQIRQTRELVSRLSDAGAPPDVGTADWAKLLEMASKRNFVSGESQTIRLANVQSAIVQILAADNVKPRSVRNLPPRVRAGLTLVGVQVQIGASLAQLQSMLNRIDNYQPRMLLEDLQITRTGQSVVPSEGAQQLLDLRLDVFGIEPPSEIAKVQQ
jgi:hypothetical protein